MFDFYAEQGERETLPEPLDCQLPSVISNTFGADVLIWGCHNLIPCDDILGLYFFVVCLLVVVGLEPSTLKMQKKKKSSTDFHIPHVL